ncbi:22780_t:CDS:2, partial [Gigaspora rosea]
MDKESLFALIFRWNKMQQDTTPLQNSLCQQSTSFLCDLGNCLSKSIPSEFEHKDLVLVEATPEQARITNRNSYMSWGYPMLTIDEYIEREEILANNEFTLENFKVWILVSKLSLITIPSRQIREVIGYYITSLFTPSQYQHKVMLQ